MNDLFEEVYKVETKDGRLFDSGKQAVDYVTDCVCADINEIIKGVETCDLKHRDLTAIICALAGTEENLKRLYAILDKHL